MSAFITCLILGKLAKKKSTIIFFVDVISLFFCFVTNSNYLVFTSPPSFSRQSHFLHDCQFQIQVTRRFIKQFAQILGLPSVWNQCAFTGDDTGFLFLKEYSQFPLSWNWPSALIYGSCRFEKIPINLVGPINSWLHFYIQACKGTNCHINPSHVACWVGHLLIGQTQNDLNQ